MRILVADSDSKHRNTVVQLITQLGCHAIEALSAQEVLRHCRDKCPDLCLLDVQLSGASGVDLVKQIRHLGGVAVWNHILLMGTAANAQQFKDGIAAGADDFFLKPIDPLRLEYKINAAKRHEDLKEQVFAVAHDLVLANHALENVVNKDRLTGIADLNTLHKSLEAEWFKAREKNTDLSLVILGLDCFKRYNALYGAELGDRQIQAVAIALNAALQDVQPHTFARTVGESFAVLLPGIEQKRAVVLAKKLLSTIEALAIAHADSKCSAFLTASAGVASIKQESFKNPLELLEAGDYALYQAKHKGRNQVYCEQTALAS